MEEPQSTLASTKPAYRRWDIASELGSLEVTDAALRDVLALAEAQSKQHSR